MKKYGYLIVGRTPGSVHHTSYEGAVEAETSKEAILKALANEFGDKNADPFASLTDWVDEELLQAMLNDLNDDDDGGALDTGDNTFDIEVYTEEENAERAWQRKAKQEVEELKAGKQVPGIDSLTLISDCRVGVITFGGKEFWTAKAGEVFPFSFLVEANDSFIVVQSGLNYYVFETTKVKKGDK